MPTIVKRPQAEADLDEIWWYIAQDNPDAADRMLDRIEESCNTLAQFPLMGISREESLPSLRSHAASAGTRALLTAPVPTDKGKVRIKTMLIGGEGFPQIGRSA